MKQEYVAMYESIVRLLSDCAVNDHAREVLAPMIAKKSLLMHHLYEDMGFKSRSEMGKFMMDNFTILAQEKPKDKLWKKYLYDKIGEVAPACATCDDQQTCFRCLVSELSA